MKKNCISCKHWDFNPGYPDLSEVTPGEDWSMNCMKNHWNMTGFDVTKEEYRETLQKADNCKDFEEQE